MTCVTVDVKMPLRVRLLLRSSSSTWLFIPIHSFHVAFAARYVMLPILCVLNRIAEQSPPLREDDLLSIRRQSICVACSDIHCEAEASENIWARCCLSKGLRILPPGFLARLGATVSAAGAKEELAKNKNRFPSKQSEWTPERWKRKTSQNIRQRTHTCSGSAARRKPSVGTTMTKHGMECWKQHGNNVPNKW